MKKLETYRDSRGWLGHFEYNPILGTALHFGDGVQRMSMEAVFDFVLARSPLEASVAKASFIRREQDIYLESGEPVRHWSRDQWYGKSGTMSGDQLEPLMWAYVVFDMREEFWLMFRKLMKRGFFAWNTKKIGQMEESKYGDFFLLRSIPLVLRILWISGFFWKLVLTPLILLWDLTWLGLNTVTRVLHPLIFPQDTSDDLNFTVWLVVTKLVCPNPIAYFWRNIYLAFRPKAKGEGAPFDPHYLGAQTAFLQYFYPQSAPPLDQKALKVLVWL